MRLTVATIALVTVCLLFCIGVSLAADCEKPVAVQPHKQQLWEYPVGLACVLLLFPAYTAAYWDVEKILKGR